MNFATGLNQANQLGATVEELSVLVKMDWKTLTEKNMNLIGSW